jgi:hypothetical protein
MINGSGSKRPKNLRIPAKLSDKKISCLGPPSSSPAGHPLHYHHLLISIQAGQMVAYQSAGADMHCRARVQTVDASRRTATLFLMDEGRQAAEVSWDCIRQLTGEQQQQQLLLRPGLAIRVHTATPATDKDATYVVRRCPDGQLQLCPVDDDGGEQQRRSLDEMPPSEVLEQGGGGPAAALLQGFNYERLTPGPGTFFILQFTSPQMLFVIAEACLDR